MLFLWLLPLANCKFVVAITSCQLYDNKEGGGEKCRVGWGEGVQCTVAERKQINWRQALIGLEPVLSIALAWPCPRRHMCVFVCV